MRSPWPSAALPIGGGLNLTDAPGRLAAGQVLELRNLMIDGAGKVSPRAAAGSLLTPTGDVVGLFRFPFYGDATPIGALMVTYSAGSVFVTRLRTNGAVVGTAIAAWTGLSERPVVHAGLIGQRLFLCGRSAGANLDLVYFDAATETLVTPQFDFTGGTDYEPMQTRLVAVYNNFLWAGGYGAHTDADRPELLRWSYLGLQADSEGGGDAGDTGDPDSQGIFDLDDQVQIGERGTAVMAFVPTLGRALVLTSRAAHHLWGYSRTTFTQEMIDGQRGVVGRHSWIDANGRAFYWSRLGPCMYQGSALSDLSYRLTPRLPLIQQAGIVAVHEEENYGVRWYYPDGATMRSLFWSYQREEWTEGKHPFTIFCAGEIATSSTHVTSGVVDPPAGPAGDPTAAVSLKLTSTSATIGFTTGDAEAQTEVRLSGALVATLDPGVDEVTFENLDPDTTYSFDFRHLKNGQHSNSLVGNFTTADEDTTPNEPANPVALWMGNGVQLSWGMGQSGMLTQIQRRMPPEAFDGIFETVAVNETSYFDTAGTSTENHSPDYRYRVRHQLPSDPSVVSDWSNEMVVIL